MSEMAVPRRVTIAAVPGQVGLARAFVAGALGQAHPAADVAVLLASELVTNSVRHSGSAVSGGDVTVAVTVGRGGARVEVTDRSGDGAPVLASAASGDGNSEGSRGMRLVDALASRWGYWRGGGFATTWFEMQALSQPMQHSTVSDESEVGRVLRTERHTWPFGSLIRNLGAAFVHAAMLHREQHWFVRCWRSVYLHINHGQRQRSSLRGPGCHGT